MTHFADKPETPVLSTDNSNPTDGESISLTCTTATTGVSSYEFKRGTTSLVNGAYNVYNIPTATIDADDDDYLCIAYIDTVASDVSNVITVLCESTFCEHMTVVIVICVLGF